MKFRELVTQSQSVRVLVSRSVSQLVEIKGFLPCLNNNICTVLVVSTPRFLKCASAKKLQVQLFSQNDTEGSTF